MRKYEMKYVLISDTTYWRSLYDGYGFLTLGIGEYCNWYFLRMLAKLGRGFSDIVIHEERIYHKIDHLLPIWK